MEELSSKVEDICKAVSALQSANKETQEVFETFGKETR